MGSRSARLSYRRPRQVRATSPQRDERDLGADDLRGSSPRRSEDRPLECKGSGGRTLPGAALRVDSALSAHDTNVACAGRDRRTVVTEVLLGIDVGTASPKAVLARPDGTVIAVAQRPHGVTMPRSGWFEHDAEAVWWDDIRALCGEPSIDDRLAGICVSGIGPCVLPCDAQIRPPRPAILYGVDTRAANEIDELN